MEITDLIWRDCDISSSLTSLFTFFPDGNYRPDLKGLRLLPWFSYVSLLEIDGNYRPDLKGLRLSWKELRPCRKDNFTDGNYRSDLKGLRHHPAEEAERDEVRWKLPTWFEGIATYSHPFSSQNFLADTDGNYRPDLKGLRLWKSYSILTFGLWWKLPTWFEGFATSLLTRISPHYSADGNYRPDLKGLRRPLWPAAACASSGMEITDLIWRDCDVVVNHCLELFVGFDGNYRPDLKGLRLLQVRPLRTCSCLRWKLPTWFEGIATLTRSDTGRS